MCCGSEGLTQSFGLKFKHARCAGCRAGSERSGVEWGGVGWSVCVWGVGINLCVPLNGDEEKSERRSSLVTHTVGKPSLDVVSPNTGRFHCTAAKGPVWTGGVPVILAVAKLYASQKPEAPHTAPAGVVEFTVLILTLAHFFNKPGRLRNNLGPPAPEQSRHFFIIIFNGYCASRLRYAAN